MLCASQGALEGIDDGGWDVGELAETGGFVHSQLHLIGMEGRGTQCVDGTKCDEDAATNKEEKKSETFK